MKFTFIPINFESFELNNQTYIQVYGRNEKGKRLCILKQFNDWCYIIKDIEKAKKKLDTIKIQEESKNFLGKPVKALKVYTSSSKQTKEIAEKFEVYENDINIITKFLIENKLTPLTLWEIEGELASNNECSNLEVDFVIKAEKITQSQSDIQFHPKFLAYDIETNEFEIGKGEILMISLVGNNFKKVLTWKKQSKKSFVEYFKDEAEMLEAFVKYIKEYSPDFLVGYFSDGFDLPYLRARAEHNKVKLSLGLDNSAPIFSRGRVLSGKIKGITHVDLFRFIQVAYSQYLQSETLSLNEVANELIGEKKNDISHIDMNKTEHTQKHWEDFFEYNLQDSVLTYKLFEKVWPDILEFSRVLQEPPYDVSRDSMSQNVENYILHNLHKFNEIAKHKASHEEISNRIEREKYEGAFVFQPKPGLYNDIAMFDFSSMYASVIVSYNLSLSTLSKEKTNIISEINNKKVYFSKKPGFFPELLKQIIEKRREFKKEYNKNPNPILKARSNAFKLIANAAYGYQGFFGARYYCLEAAASTAYFARENIKSAIKKFEQSNFQPIYSDTDSIAVSLDNKSKKQALDLLKQINEHLPGIMELELEDFYKRGIWVTKRTGEFGAKKKYALITEDNKLKIRGFETVRRDWCNLAREVQSKILKLILTDGNEKKALEYIKETIKKIKERKIELSELVIRTQLKKSIDEYKANTPHIAIARKMIAKNIPINLGMLIQYYIAESDNKKALVRDRAKMIDESGKYDINYYLNNQILPAVENIFEVFNVDINQLIEGKKQMKLGEF
ncbi:MAG: DNA-directed DNA polymerase [Candidatus Pacearchaeota archaeon]